MAVGPLNQAAVTATFKERYRDLVAQLYEAEDSACQLIEKRADVEITGPRGVIAAKKIKPAGKVGTFSLDGGDLGRGTGAQYDKTTLTPIPLRVAVEYTLASKLFTGSQEIAILNAIKDLTKDGVTNMKVQQDRYLFGAGDGVLFNVASGQGTTALVGSLPIGSRWVYPGQTYQVYDATKTTNRGQVTVDTVDVDGNTTNLVSAMAAMLATDVLVPEGLSGASPTWLYGTQYHFTASTAGLWLGLSRTTYPDLKTPTVTASGPLVPTHIRKLKNIMNMRRPGCFKKGRWTPVMHPAQMQAYEEIGLMTTQYRMDGQRGGLDVLFDQDQLRVDGFTPLSEPNQRPDRIDLLNWDNFYRAETMPFGLYTVDELSEFPIYGASGGPSTSTGMYYAQVFQWGVDDPALSGVVASLTVPSGYQGN